MKKTLFSFTMIVLAVVSANAQTADEIISKYITAIGGTEKWSKIQSIKMEGQIEVQGLAIPYTMQGVHQKGMRVDAEFQGNKIIDIITPTQGWSQNPLGGKYTLSPLTAEELKTKADDLDIQDPFVNYKEKGSSIEYLGKDEEDGNEYFKVKLTTKNKNDKTFFIDTKTYLIYKAESTTTQQGQDMKVSIKYLDYQTVDFGVKIPFKQDMGMMMMVNKKITLNAVVDEAIFSGK